MKMSDVFEGKVISHDGMHLLNGSREIRLEYSDGCKLADFGNKKQSDHAAVAINNHDALVDALEFCVSEMKNYDFMCDETKCDAVIKLGDIEKLLAKAKGES
jgi:hypothetical protein